MSLLKIEPSNDIDMLNSICNLIFDKPFLGASIGYVLFEGEKPIGVSKLSIKKDLSQIDFIGIISEKRKKGIGDFFTRSLLYTLSCVSSKIIINYCDDYFLKFGFCCQNKKMMINCKDIVFPRACEHRGDKDVK